MKNNSKTLTIETKKLWITGVLLSLVASVYPAIDLANGIKDNIQPDASTLTVVRFTYPVIFIMFFVFTTIFILLCKWQGKKNR